MGRRRVRSVLHPGKSVSTSLVEADLTTNH